MPARIFSAALLFVSILVAPSLCETVQEMLDRQFEERTGPEYRPTRDKLYTILQGLQSQLSSREARGESLPCSQQIYAEAKWYVNYTADWDGAKSRLSDLAESLLPQSKNQSFAAEQQRDGGYWGPCFLHWFNRVDAMITNIGLLQAANRGPDFPITFVRNLTEPGGIEKYYASRQFSDILGDSIPIDHREELGAVTGAFHQLAFKDYLREWLDTYNRGGFTLSDSWVDAYTAFVDSSTMRDPETGMWGETYRNGTEWVRGQDLSLTYHALTYRKARGVSGVNTTLKSIRTSRSGRYPYGWLTAEGHLVNHNTMDIAKLVRDGARLGAVGAAESRLWRTQFQEMLDFALHSPLSVHSGTHCFAMNPFYESPGAAYYFGAAALAAMDYFAPAGTSVFWDTSARFPENRTVCCDIAACLKRNGAVDPSSQEAMLLLQENCPSCTSE